MNACAECRVLFSMLTSREPPFKEALYWLQFAYTVDRSVAYVAPASTALAQSAILEGGEVLIAILQYLQRLYMEVYGPAVSLGWDPDCRYSYLR